ncbi:MAG: phosphoglycerate mutase [Pirellulaceae bacterium]|nr:MAG: phosphoglycerate mutase [Pirellulaceae bacterium]
MSTEQVELLLIRPGATPFDEEGRIKGALDLPLSMQGMEQARVLAERLATAPPDILYAAPTEYAEHTSRIIAQRSGCRVKLVDSLENLDFGLWQGKLTSEVRRTQPRVYRQFQESPELVCPPGGETVSAAIGRAQKALSKILRRHRGGRVGLVVPHPFCQIVRSTICQQSLGDLWRCDLDFGTFESIVVDAVTGAMAELVKA